MAAEREPLLALRGVCSGYGSVPVVRDVELDIAPTEIVAVVGRNGVGKTTLVKSIIGLLPCNGGSISFMGSDITRLKASARARLGIGYVPQGRGIFADLSVEENLLMGALVGGGQSAHYERVFELFPILKERRKQRGGTLSGGQQQMLAIGRVLVGSPKLLLLDEPSEGIQPSIVQGIGDLVRRLRDEEGLTVFLVEQNWGLVMRTADRGAAMDKGEIVARLDASQLQDEAVATRFLAV